MWVYRGEYVRGTLPSAPSKTAADDSGAVYDGDLDDGDWEVADLEPTPGDVFASRPQKIQECLRRVQQARQEAGLEVPQNLMGLLSSLVDEAVLCRPLQSVQA